MTLQVGVVFHITETIGLFTILYNDTTTDET